jgi:hypothetical protein
MISRRTCRYILLVFLSVRMFLSVSILHILYHALPCQLFVPVSVVGLTAGTTEQMDMRLLIS